MFKTANGKLLIIFLFLSITAMACALADPPDAPPPPPVDPPIEDQLPEIDDDLDDEPEIDPLVEDDPIDPNEDTPVPLAGNSLELRDVRFSQLDFNRPDGTIAVENSCWGQVEWIYTPAPDQLNFLNVEISPGEDVPPGWVVQNLPLFPPTNGDTGDRTEAAFFNLCDVGIEPGEPILDVNARVLVSDEVLSFPDRGEFFPDTFFDSLNQVNLHPAFDNGPDGPFDPGFPLNISVHAPPLLLNLDRDVRAVQEGGSQCLAGSFARSIDWLNREFSMGSSLNGQQIFEGLTGVGVSSFDDDLSLGADMAKQIRLKDTYANSITENRVLTTVWDPGTNIDPVAGMTEDNGDFLEWLTANANNDLEVGYSYPGNAHIVTVTDVYTADGETWVKYRDDEVQGNDSVGDTAVKHAKVYKHADGTYRFGSDSNKIYMGFSESYNPNEKDLDAFIALMEADWEHGSGESYIFLGLLALMYDPIPAPDASIVVRMDLDDGTSLTQTAVTDENGRADFMFTIYFYGEYQLTVESIERDGLVYTPGKNLVDTIAVNVVGGNTDPFHALDAVKEFYSSFNHAFAVGDVQQLTNLLHKESRLLYGENACYSYLESVIDSPPVVEVLGIGSFDLWQYEKDGRSIPIFNTFSVDVNFTVNGETTQAVTHLAIRDDGTLGWFTDCGDPME